MRQNACTLWSLIRHLHDDVVIVRWTLLYNIAIACLIILFFAYLLHCYHVFQMNKDIYIYIYMYTLQRRYNAHR